jgi:hypothetical protein
VSRPQEMIADALREIAVQAGAPRPMAEAAWRAGRRRRRAALTISAVAGAAAIMAAVLLPLAAHSQPPPRPASPPGPTAPVSLRSPIQFRQVAAISSAPCQAGSGGLPGSLPGSGTPVCFHLTGTGMTVTTVQSAQVVPSGGGYLLKIVFTPAQTGPWAALTRRLPGLPSPRDQLATIIDGRVIADSAVVGPITDGTTAIPGFVTRAQAESLLSSLRSQ